MKYTFDGYDRVEDENGVLYRDGLDKRSGPIVVDLLDEIEDLRTVANRLATLLDERNRKIAELEAQNDTTSLD